MLSKLSLEIDLLCFDAFFSFTIAYHDSENVVPQEENARAIEKRRLNTGE